MNKISSKLLIIPIFALLIFISGCSRIPFSDCQKLHDEIEKDISNANYCQTDLDCKELKLGGDYIEFGCYHYVNKNTDQGAIYKKLGEYDKMNCSLVIDDCSPTPLAKCIADKCQ